MAAAKWFLLLFLVAAAPAFAQEQEQEGAPLGEDLQAPLPVPAVPVRIVSLGELEQLAIGALRKEFPRPSGILASTSSCRLPEYGPLVSITLQLPAVYFTGPVLKELEMRQRKSEERARLIRLQLNRTAEMIRLKARESELLQQIEGDNKKVGRAVLVSLQGQLQEVRETIKGIEAVEPVKFSEPMEFELQQVDLEKMMAENYQGAIQRIATAMQSVLAENAVFINEIDSEERIVIATHIRDNFLQSQERSILFILKGSDIAAYRAGEMDLSTLRTRVVVKHETKE